MTPYRITWHLPTAAPAYTGREFIKKAAHGWAVMLNYLVLGRAAPTLAGLLQREVREFREMLYQNTHDYWFDSSRFSPCFAVTPTSYAKGIVACVAACRRQAGG